MKKRMMSLLLTLSLILAMLPGEALAASSSDDGGAVPEDDIPLGDQWTNPAYVDNDHHVRMTFYISGTLAKVEFLDEATGEVVVPDSITYRRSSDQEVVTAPVIGIGSNVCPVGESNLSLTSITIPSSVTSINSRAFDTCSNLESVTFAAGSQLSKIGDLAFNKCSSLSTLDLPGGLAEVGNYTFSGAGLTSLELPDTLQKLGEGVFSGCTRLESVSIPVTPDIISGFWKKNNGFQNCSRLKKITVPEGVDIFGTYFFLGCNALEEVELPASLTDFNMYAFQNCRALKTVKIASGSHLTRFANYVFDGCTSLAQIDFPETLTTVGRNTFSGCTSLTQIDLPENLAEIGAYAFNGCTGLTEVEIPSARDIYAYAFAGCTGLTRVMLPTNLETIGAYAFQNTGLTTVTIPRSVTDIGERAFTGVPLTDAFIFSREVAFGNYAFPNSGTMMHGYTGSTTDTAYSGDNRFVPLDIRTLTATVKAPDGTVLTEGFTINWYESGESGSLGSGFTFTNASVEKDYEVEIVLDEALKARYEPPARRTIRASDPNTIVVELELAAPETVALTGSVKDSEGGNPIEGAAVTVEPLNAALGIQAKTVFTGTDGSFRVEEAPCVPVRVTVSKDGCYRQQREFDLTAAEGTYEITPAFILERIEAETNQILLTVTQRRAVGAGAAPLETELSSLGMLRFTVTGENGESITDFEVQGSMLVFDPGALDAEDIVTVTAEDPTGQYAPGDDAVELSRNKTGNAELPLVEKGSFTLGELDGPEEVSLMVFRGAEGAESCVYAGTARTGAAYAPMDSGTYTVVLMEKTDLLRGVSELSRFGDLGLTAGEDYLSLPVEIRDGVIASLGDLNVPALNEDLFTYTVAENTNMTIAKSGNMYPGEVFLLRVAYELDAAKNMTAGDLRIAFPAEIRPYERSVLVNNAAEQYTYDENTRVATISAGGDKAVAYLYCEATGVGNHVLNGYLTMDDGTVTQPIGTALVSVENAGMEIPFTTTAGKEISASGLTAPGATVQLYDNDVEIPDAVVTANSAGRWSVTFRLPEPTYGYSYHFIHAVITGDRFPEPVVTEESFVVYDPRTVPLERITMYNVGDGLTAQETVIDFTSKSTNAPKYYFNPEHPTFTFQVKYNENDTENTQAADVYVVTENYMGDQTYVKTAYDAPSGTWIGTQDYNSFTIPMRVGALRAADDRIPENGIEAMKADLRETAVTAYQDFYAEQSGPFHDVFDLSHITLDRDGQTGEGVVYYTDGNGVGHALGSLKVEVKSVGDEAAAESLLAAGYADCWNYEDGGIGEIGWPEGYGLEPETYFWKYEPAAESDGQTPAALYLVDLSEKLEIQIFATPEDSIGDSPETVSMLMSLYGGRAAAPGVKTAAGLVLIMVGASAAAAVAGVVALPLAVSGICVVGVATGIGGMVGTLISAAGISAWSWHTGQKELEREVVTPLKWRVKGNVRRLQSRLQECRDAIEYRCADGSYRIPLKQWRMNLSARADAFAANIEAYAGKAEEAIEKAKSSGNGYVLLSMLPFASEAADVIGEFIDTNAELRAVAQGAIDALCNALMDRLDEFMREITQEQEAYNCEQPEDEPGTPGARQGSPNMRKTNGVLDPSGYVYEAVPSNRLEGVTAAIYKKGGEEKWDAEDYSQINPVSTGADGYYHWDVPTGEWKVKFSKNDEYLSAETDWLPVPPPQLNINVGMTSTAAPAVDTVQAYSDGVIIAAFSQYMDIDSVGKAATINGGAVRSEPLDAEDSPEGIPYATRFALSPAGEGGNAGGAAEVIFAVSGGDDGAKNYAGTPLASAYSRTLTAALAPSPDSIRLRANDISIGLDQVVNISFELLSGDSGAANQTLTVESLTENLLEIVEGTETVTTNAGGEATFKLRGRLPGEGVVRISDSASGVSDTIYVHISRAGEIPSVSVSYKNDNGGWTGVELQDGVTRLTLPAGAEISLGPAGETIYYTLNGACPCKRDAERYTESIRLSAEMMNEDGKVILRAAAYRDGVYSKTIRLEITVTGTPAPVHTHDWSEEWKRDDAHHWHECKNANCDAANDSDKNGYGPHTAGAWIVDQEAASTTAGLRHKECTVCDYVMERETIPATGGSTSGDPSAGGPSSGSPSAGSLSVGGSSAGSSVTVSKSSTRNGSYKLSSSVAKAGDTVTITPQPDSGYVVDAVTVTDKAGKAVAVTENGDGTYSFVVPERALQPVKTAVTFKPAGQQTTPGTTGFSDVASGAYYADAVAWAVEKGITTGAGNGLFSPDSPCTRAQIATFLWRAAGSPKAAGANPFTDVASDAYYYDAVLWAVANNITTGTGDGTTFSPDVTCTRGQAVTFLWRNAGQPAAAGGGLFTDVDANQYYSGAVNWAVAGNITAGTGNGLFSPDAACTRGQIVTFLYRGLA